MVDVFISYKRSDRATAESVARELERYGLSVWWDGKLLPGIDWSAELGDQIRKAKQVVVLWPKDGVESKMLYSEAALASEQGKLISVQMGDQPPPDFFVLHQQIRADSIDAVVARIVDELSRRFGRPLLEHGPAVPLPPRIPSEPRRENKGFAFLSYCLDDFDFRNRVTTFLTTQNYLYWEFAESERQIEKMLVWELEEQIVSSRIVLSIISPAWKKSAWCMREYFFAKELGKPVFLLRSAETGPTLAVAGETIIDFVSDNEKGFAMLGRELQRRGL